MWLGSHQVTGSVERNDVFSLIWRCYGPKRDILDYWGTLIFHILSYYILSMDKGLIGLKEWIYVRYH